MVDLPLQPTDRPDTFMLRAPIADADLPAFLLAGGAGWQADLPPLRWPGEASSVGRIAMSGSDSTFRRVRLIVARCEVTYSAALRPAAGGRAAADPQGRRLGARHDDAGGYKPLNWMTAPTFIADEGDRLVVTKAKSEDVLEIRLLDVLSDVVHDMGESAALQKDGVERDLQEALAAAPETLGESLTLVRREWPTEIGPVDLMCHDEAGSRSPSRSSGSGRSRPSSS